ncbi:hypothetical protein B0H11DRAFT_1914980 [Mycena galericulata]|nr:hypothetical protein B0H11DRAFT_1914980 [Mycena galericulata]
MLGDELENDVEIFNEITQKKYRKIVASGTKVSALPHWVRASFSSDNLRSATRPLLPLVARTTACTPGLHRGGWASTLDPSRAARYKRVQMHARGHVPFAATDPPPREVATTAEILPGAGERSADRGWAGASRVGGVQHKTRRHRAAFLRASGVGCARFRRTPGVRGEVARTASSTWTAASTRVQSSASIPRRVALPIRHRRIDAQASRGAIGRQHLYSETWRYGGYDASTVIQRFNAGAQIATLKTQRIALRAVFEKLAHQEPAMLSAGTGASRKMDGQNRKKNGP